MAVAPLFDAAVAAFGTTATAAVAAAFAYSLAPLLCPSDRCRAAYTCCTAAAAAVRDLD